MKQAVETAPQADLAGIREQMKTVIVGHVDHGKSTLVGRLFHDTDSLPDGKFEQVQASCKRRGMQFEWAFLMDALQAERDQEITIDTSQIWFKTEKRDYVIIDAPGHKEFLKNMISGAASSEAALLIIDAKEGVQEQSKRHGYLLHLLGVRQITVAVNKMDLVDYSEERFLEVEKEYREYLANIGVTPKHMIPISAREGDNIANRSDAMGWYNGPTIIEALDTFEKKPELIDLPLRLPIQDVYRFDEHKRIFAGRIESGSIKVGDEVVFSPSNKVSRVKTIERWGRGEAPSEVFAGMSVGITLDEQIFVERGEVASLNVDMPVLTNLFRARMFWLGSKNLEPGKWYTMKINTSEYRVGVREVEHVISTDDLAPQAVKAVTKNSVAEVVMNIRGLAAIDEFEANEKTGRFMLLDGYDVVGGGIISMEGFSDQRVAESHCLSSDDLASDKVISPAQRQMLNGHAGAVLWFSGRPGSGKTSLAFELEKRLFAKGYQVYVLDEEVVNAGLCADLGDDDAARATAYARVAEVAGLFAKAGMIVITSLVSAKSEDRRRARAVVPESFHSIYIEADEATCQARENTNPSTCTGFEEPDNADVNVDNQNQSIEQSVDQLVDYVDANIVGISATGQSDNTGGGI